MAKAETKEEVQENRTLTPDEITAAAQREEAEEYREKLVTEGADERPKEYVAYPPPATSSWIAVPNGYWGDNTNDLHENHAVQVVQVHTYPNAPTVVTLRCDCSYEWRLTWDVETARAVGDATVEATGAGELAQR